MTRAKKDVAFRTFIATNHTEDINIDCNSTSDGELADYLVTLVKELSEQGIIKSSIT